MSIMERLDPRAIERISGPAWSRLRLQFEQIHQALIDVAATVHGTLTTIYVKYTDDDRCRSEPFAVLWTKTSKQLVLGLALPETFNADLLGAAPPRHSYAGLTRYLVIAEGETIPVELAEWGRAAYEHVSTRRT